MWTLMASAMFGVFSTLLVAPAFRNTKPPNPLFTTSEDYSKCLVLFQSQSLARRDEKNSQDRGREEVKL